MEAEHGYLTSVGGKVGTSQPDAMAAVRSAMLDAVAARATGDLPDVGPRGGKRWSPRYAVRRSAWHSLDHAWEIEDRADAEAGGQ